MNQDLMDWLNGRPSNSRSHSEIFAGPAETGLLLAPINNVQHLNSDPESLDNNAAKKTDETGKHESEPSEFQDKDTKEPGDNIDNINIKESEAAELESNYIDDSYEENDGEGILESTVKEFSVTEETENYDEDGEIEEHELFEPLEPDDEDGEVSDAEPENTVKSGPGEINLENIYRESLPGIEQELNDPPPELWTQIVPAPDDYELDPKAHIEDSELKRGTKFTQRLQNILQGRKNKAAEREYYLEPEAKNSYLSRAVFMCSILLLVIGGACLFLVFLQHNSPEYLNEKASALFNQERYEEAIDVYQKAYKLYPNVLVFLTGLAKSAEKAGHFQTANVAWDEYKNALPKEEKELRDAASREIERIKDGKKQDTEEEEPEEKEIKTEKEENNDDQSDIQNGPEKVIYSFEDFDDLLQNGNVAFNSGRYDDALINFFYAFEVRSNDVRPWLGLAGAYRAKGANFDALRVLESARKIFKKDPTIETMLKILRGE